MHVLIWFRRKESEASRPNPSGFLQVRISYAGKRCGLGSTHIRCLDSQWDRDKQAIAGSSAWAREQNEKIRLIKHKIQQVYHRLLLEGADINAGLIKERCLQGHVVIQLVQVEENGKTITKRVTRRKVYTFADLHDFYVIHQQRLVDREQISSKTLRRKKNYLNNIQAFLATCQKANSPATSLTDLAMENLTDYLLHEKKFKYSHVEKHLRYIKEVMSWSVTQQHIRHNPIDKFRIAPVNEAPDTTHLSTADLNRLILFDFNELVQKNKLKKQMADALAKERDAFVFNCFTGMHHVDYKEKNFVVDENGKEFWLTGVREKTGGVFNLPLLSPAIDIFKKYGKDLNGLPAISLTHRNKHLHLIAAHCELAVDLTTKIARKTFADMTLNVMMLDAHDVAAMLGLNSTRQLQHYVRPRRTRLRKIFKSWDDIASNLDE